MKKLLALFGMLALFAVPALAANVVVQEPYAVWSNSTGVLQGFGIPGQGQSGYTAIQVNGAAISLPNGTVAAPSLAFTSDVDTGIYRIGANNLGVAANGAKVLDVGTTGLGVTGVISASGVINASNGTVALPALTFTSDPDSGFYRIGANNVGAAVNGAKVLDIGTTGLGVTGTISASDNVSTTAAGKGLIIKNGSNARAGSFTCTSGGTIVVSNSSYAITDSVLPSLNTLGGSISAPPFVIANSAGVSFSMKCATSDTSVYNYTLFGQN